MTEYLLPNELFQLTGYVRGTSQATWLKDRALPHQRDGQRVIISRNHVKAWLEGRPVISTGLNLAAIK